MTVSRAISDLHPELQSLCKQFLRSAEEKKIGVIITCTYRSSEEQNRLYAMGRTTISHVGVTPARPLGRIVTNAKGGQSAHNFEIDGKPASKAWDFVPMLGGKPVWDENSPLWQALGKIATDLGLNWYGSPGSRFKEFPHVQMKESV